MDNTGKGMAVFLLYRYDIPVIADCNQGILEIFLVFFILQHIVNVSFRLPFQFGNPRSQAQQLNRRIIADLMILIKYLGNFVNDKGKITDNRGLTGQAGVIAFFF